MKTHRLPRLSRLPFAAKNSTGETPTPARHRRNRPVTVAVLLLAAVFLMASCGFEASTTGYEDPEAQRTRADAAATSTVIAAEVQAQATRAALDLEQDRQDHRQALQMQPVILMVFGGGIVVIFGIAGAVLIWRQQSIRLAEVQRPAAPVPAPVPAASLPAPTVNIVNVLPGPGQSRRRMYQQLSQDRDRAVTIYDERGNRSP